MRRPLRAPKDQPPQGPNRGYYRRQKRRRRGRARPGQGEAPATRTRGMAVNGGATAESRSSRLRGPAMRAPSMSTPLSPRSARRCRWRRLDTRDEEMLRDRRIEAGHDRPAVFHQRRRYRPIGKAGDVGAGAVDRIDHPDAARGEPGGIVDALFRQPGDGLAAGGKALPQQDIDGDVGLADRRFGRSLGPVLQRRAEHPAGQHACFTHRALQPFAETGQVVRCRQPSGPPRARSAHWCRNGTQDRSPASGWQKCR